MRLLIKIYEYIKFTFFKKYHIIDCRNKQCDYRYGWCDRRELMFYACFNILKDFIEKEYPGYIDWEHELTKDIHTEMIDLYNWWTKDRQKEHDIVNNALEEFDKDVDFLDCFKRYNDEYFEFVAPKHFKDPKYKELTQKSLDLEKKDQIQLERLIKIREHLWT